MLWSILIPTLHSRKEKFERLKNEIFRQVYQAQLRGMDDIYGNVEVLSEPNGGDMLVGYYRNILLNRSRAKYVSYFDDDDWPHKDYVESIYLCLRFVPDPDVVTFKGEVNFNGTNTKKIVMSARTTAYMLTENTFHWPPTHLCVARRAIAEKYLFNETVRLGSDKERALAMVRDNAFRKDREVFIDKRLYFYNYDSTKNQKKV